MSQGERGARTQGEEFLETVAHEVRTPLSIVRMAAETLATDELPATDRDRLLAMVVRNTDIALRLVDRITLARDVARGTITVEPEDVDLAALVRETVSDLVAAVLDGHPVKLSASHPVVITADTTALREILFNLLLNAAKYSPKGTPIRVRVQGNGDGLGPAIVVRDQGPGIDPVDREHIFDPYYQGSGASHGAGLGLFISRGLARAHGGELEVRPAERAGSEFILRLPRTAPARHPAAQHATSPAAWARP